MSNRAWVTLATNDSYGLGALVLAHSLRRVGSTYPAVVLITPSVTDAMRDRLRAVFTEVVTVDVLDSRDAAHLALLQRPELGITFTKIHCWNLTQYEKCVFLDADALVVQNCDELFEREELSAAPDVGWPDCFNSGVFVYTPSADTFNRLVQFAQERGSFDGGDQGLLNSFFSDWAHGDINKHLPFLYNVTSAAFYSYMPALKHYGQNLKIIHFIGAAKPWLQHFNWESRAVDAPEHLRQFLQLWWDLFVVDVHAQLDVSMSGVAGNLARVALGSSQREAIDELTRRQGWEAGNIDYMGVDSFDNIWAKISQTLSQARPSPPKQSPPRESGPAQIAPEIVEVQTGEIAKEPIIEPVEVAKEVVPSEEPLTVQDPGVTAAVVSTESAALSTQTTDKGELASQSEIITPTETQLETKTSPTIGADISAVAPAPASVSETSAQTLPLTTVKPVSESVIVTEPSATTKELTATGDLVPAEKVSEQALIFQASATDKPPVTIMDTVATKLTTTPAVIEAPAPETPVFVDAKEKSEAITEPVKVPSTDTQSESVQEVVKEKAKVPATETTPGIESTPGTEIAPAIKTVPATKIATPPEITPASAVATATETKTVPITETVVATKTAPVDPVAVPVKVPSAITAPTGVAEKIKTQITETIPVKPVAETPKVDEPVQVTQAAPAETPVCPIKSTPEKTVPSDSATDSPPLANTPSKEEIPDVSAAKSAERRKPAGKLQLSPPVAPDPLPTPDSELEDAAALAQSIIASELRTPTVTSPGSASSPASPPAPKQHSRLLVDEPVVPTPPVGAVSLTQIGVKTKGKTTTAAQIESSVSEKPESTTSTPTEPTAQKTETAPAEVPKKKVVKKVVKKVSATGGDTPVPPPRKKEKKPKE